MRTHWQPTRLGDVLQLVRRSETVQPTDTYDLIGVRLDGAGPFLRETKTGDQISANQLFRVAAGDFIYSRLFAWRGAFGTIGQGLDGKYVSGEFPTFVANADRLDAEFLRLWFRLPSTLRTVESLCSGSTPLTRNRFKEQFFIDLEIPLPPLAEQQRIVALLDALAARIEEAKGLRAQAVAEVEALKGAAAVREFDQILAEFGSVPLGRVISFRYDLIRPIDGVTGPLRFIGLQHIESHTGKRVGEDNVKAEDLTGRKFIFSPGEIVYGYLRPYLNKVWIADREGVCSVDQYVIRPNSKLIDTEYLAQFMLSPRFLERANDLTHNLMLPRLRTKLLESIQIPVPPVELQHRVVAYLNDRQAKVDAVKVLQAETQAELDALLPAVLDRAFRGEL